MLARSGCSLQGFTLLTVTTVSQKFNFFTCINKLSFTKNLESTDENGDFLKKTVNWSTVLRLQSHYGETIYFLPLSPRSSWDLSFYLIFFHECSRFTGLQRKGETISLTSLYHFHSIHRHISRSITAECSPLHIACSRIQVGTYVFRAQVANH